MADENTKGAGGLPAVTIPEIPAGERITIPAATALGLDEAPGVSLDREAKRITAADPAADAARKADEERAAAEKSAAEKKAADEKAAAEKSATDKTAEEKAAAEKKAADEKAAAEKAAAEKKAADDKAKKKTVTIGGKEYTEEQLEKALAERSKATQEQTETKPAAEQPKPPTPEEIATAETKWCRDFLETNKVDFQTTTDEMETILSGGKDAVELFGKKLADVCAKAVLLARKGIYNELNPVFDEFKSAIVPLAQNNEQIERATAEQQFFTQYPEFTAHADTCRQVGEALLQRYPEECRRMTREQLLNEVATQADRILQSDYKKWNPNATDTWRDAVKRAAGAGAAGNGAAEKAAAEKAAAEKTAAEKAAAEKAAAEKAAVNPKVKPPVANSPSGIPAAGVGPDWQTQTAKSLRD